MITAASLLEDLELIVEAEDAGLEVNLKKRIRGNLPADDTYKVTDIEKIPPGDPMKSCDNCGKAIRHICHLNGNEYVVGPDCAITLTDGPQKAKVEKYVKKEKNRSAFVRKKIKDLGENFTKDPAHDIDKWHAFLRDNKEKLTLKGFFNYSFQSMFRKNLQIVSDTRNFALDAIYAQAKSDKPDEWKTALEKAYEDGTKTRSKKYWYDDRGSMPDFYEDNKDGLFKSYGNKDLSGYFDWRSGA